jgi:uncharacterized protein YbjT (DUF2867 family)
MPVIVIGADTEHGRIAITALSQRPGEVRAFLTDPEAAPPLRRLGVKVAIGDVSDASHIEGAAHQAFSAVIIAEAGRDGRERAFAESYDGLVSSWAAALRAAGVQRIIWIGPDDAPPPAITSAVPESAAIEVGTLEPAALAAEVVRLDDLAAFHSG